MSRSKPCGPDFVICAARIRILPGITDIERAADRSGSNFFAKEAFEHILVQRQSVLGENWIPEFLELLQDLMIQARIVVIGTSQHHDTDTILALKLIEHLPRPTA